MGKQSNGWADEEFPIDWEVCKLPERLFRKFETARLILLGAASGRRAVTSYHFAEKRK